MASVETQKFLTLCEDVAVIKSTVLEIGNLRKDVDKLKMGRARDVGAAGVIGALMAWIAQRYFVLLLIFTFTAASASCAQPVGPYLADRYWHAADRPVAVYVNADMEPECIDAAREALDFWAQYVDYLEPHFVDRSVVEAGLNGISITSMPDTPTNDFAGMAYPYAIRTRSTYVGINLYHPIGCEDFRVAAHELGHGLGLHDRGLEAPRALMCSWEAGGCLDGIELDDSEIAWVNQ
jgi:hypothetical protein